MISEVDRAIHQRRIVEMFIAFQNSNAAAEFDVRDIVAVRDLALIGLESETRRQNG
jgi:hypothetical protein